MYETDIDFREELQKIIKNAENALAALDDEHEGLFKYCVTRMSMKAHKVEQAAMWM